MSHTKLDKDFCDRFDLAAPRVGVKVFRSEFEDLQYPEWKTIKDEINKSAALFLLVGQELVKSQALAETNTEARDKWKFTQNWIAYEVGVACQRGMDVWVMCDSIPINFPVPYVNNYDVHGLNPEFKPQLDFLKAILFAYVQGRNWPADEKSSWRFQCPHCKAIYNICSQIGKGVVINCPTCLNSLTFPDGWLLPAE